jgi:uncharacterized coiled-coil protein SlyX
MSLQNETLDLHKNADEAPSLEYRSVGHDSLSMFLAALGGAILGVLLTLLILAIINGGTLTYGGDARLATLEQTISRVDQNLGTLSGNVDTLASELIAVRDGLATTQSQLAAVVASQQTQVADVTAQIEGVNEAITTLDVTRERFDRFLDALSTALSETDSADAPAGGLAPLQEPTLP